MDKCKHKWVDMKDGSLDKFCVRCSKEAKQAVMSMSITHVGMDTAYSKDYTVNCENELANFKQTMNSIADAITQSLTQQIKMKN